MIRHFKVILILLLALAAPLARAADGRTVIPIDGEWTIAEGAMAAAPDAPAFNHKVPVPGLADMAQPAFEDVGVKSDRREAFWYRRTFTITGKVPAVAQLKIRQAMFGSKVILNGEVLGERQASFTPGWFDARKALKGDGAENVLLVRVGAFRDAVPASVPSGWDFEKIKYIPGIFDTVELILSGSPHIVNVQAAPNLEEKLVKVQLLVRNDSLKDVETQVALTVREAKSGKPAGAANSEKLKLRPRQQKTIYVDVPLKDCRLWSPADPFLYELEAAMPADSFKTRFGMRTFKFDPATGRAVLNGKPFFMRGSNVCIYRFCEDPARGDKPWREDWVRLLHRKFKEMHWDALRYCIGFPPEMWYRIADEEGFLIQDEFPIWHLGKWPQELKSDEIAAEYAEWMRERWNHPCVVIWDAQNESSTDQTGPALQKVRALDLSRRPWDNGWAPAMDPGDSHESHPYHFSNPDFKLEMLATAELMPRLRPEQRDQKNAIIVNEYGWLWLNRDGSPATLTSKLYQNLLGTASKASQRFELYDRYMAAETEFWRAHRKCAAVLHFCGLGYSRPDGQTSDHFIDIEKLTWEPQFYDYVRDAFAPTGLMLDFWAAQAVAGEKREIPLIAINDRDEDWKGAVRLRLLRDDKKVLEQQLPLELPALGDKRLAFAIEMPAAPGDYVMEAALLRSGEESARPVRSLRDFTLLSAEQVAALQGLAVGKKAEASSELAKDGQTYPAALAFDGKPETRWSSDFKDDQWLAVDLGRIETVMRLELSWEQAYASEYAIEVSTDGKEWKEVARKRGGKGGVEEIRLDPTDTRYIRLHALKRATPFGVSLYEMKAFRR